MSKQYPEGFKEHPNLAYFDPRQIALSQELCHAEHIEHVKAMMEHKDIDVQLACLAMRLEIILDGTYDRNDLCEVLCNRLIKFRKEGSKSIITDI